MSALQGTGIGTNPSSNYGAFLARKPNEGKIPNPSEMITGSSHIVIIDSRERDPKAYPSSSSYSIKFNNKYKNVTSIELKGSAIPKTEYNVNTGNMFIPFNLQDYVTSINIKNKGSGYIDGVYGFGATIPENVNKVKISQPAIVGGTHAEITITVVNSFIETVTINNRGSGYLAGYYGGIESPDNGFFKNSGGYIDINIPFDRNMKNQQQPCQLDVIIGTVILAQLTPGQYDYALPNDNGPGLCREITKSLQIATQNAIDDGILPFIPGGPNTGEEYFPYPTIDPDDGSCYLITTNENASPNVQVCVQRGRGDSTYVQSPFLELLWSNKDTFDSSAINIMGFGTKVSSQKFTSGVNLPPLDQTNNTFSGTIWSKYPIIGRNNYDIIDSPIYAILSFSEYSQTGDRIESTNSFLDKAFGTIVFDANSPNVIFRTPEETLPNPGTGPSSYNTLLSKPGMLKAIKGQDFDTKLLSFGPSPIAELNGITICFRKFNGDLIDFHGREHMLIFSINAEDINSGNKW